MRSSSRSGFTLIELLVVIAIIGVLSSIVLSSLNNARSKGSDAAIKSNLDQARTQAELFYDSNNNHYVITHASATDVCSSLANVGGLKGVYPSALSAAQAAGFGTVNTVYSFGFASAGVGVTCHSCTAGEGGTTCLSLNADAWAISSALKSTAVYNYCVDSTGFTGTTTDYLGGGDAHCN